MKCLPLVFFSLCIISCNQKKSVSSENKIKEGKFLCSAEWTNGVQENPKDMTKTIYVFLTITNEKNAVCNEENLAVSSVYKEIWVNDKTAEKPVWRLDKDKIELIVYDQAVVAICENKEAEYGIVDLNKFDYSFMKRYPFFQDK